ncbi:MAG: hypothetical protein EB119_10745 [Synechococcaceae bacterium WBB_34_004]|nr:hypothetical protein [Synechococcaceae bacterium WBB_34_004]
MVAGDVEQLIQDRVMEEVVTPQTTPLVFRDKAVQQTLAAVRVVEHKNIVLVNEWAKQNPRCEDSTTAENAQYISMSRAVLDGDDRNIAKVIKRVAKAVVIEKGPP